jgi:hypothetical protein
VIPFTTLHIRGLRISAFCGGLRKAEFEHIVIRKRTLAGLKAARARPRRRQAKVARRFGVSFGTVYKQVGAAAPEK